MKKKKIYKTRNLLEKANGRKRDRGWNEFSKAKRNGKNVWIYSYVNDGVHVCVRESAAHKRVCAFYTCEWRWKGNARERETKIHPKNCTRSHTLAHTSANSTVHRESEILADTASVRRMRVCPSHQSQKPSARYHFSCVHSYTRIVTNSPHTYMHALSGLFFSFQFCASYRFWA